jgi:hypothetical protein
MMKLRSFYFKSIYSAQSPYTLRSNPGEFKLGEFIALVSLQEKENYSQLMISSELLLLRLD